VEPQLAKLAADLTAYYAGLDPQGKGLLKAFTWMMFLALFVEFSSRLIPSVKKGEDPLSIVLSQPVGRAKEARTEKTEKPKHATSKMPEKEPGKNMKTPRAKFDLRFPRLPKIHVPDWRIPVFPRIAMPSIKRSPHTVAESKQTIPREVPKTPITIKGIRPAHEPEEAEMFDLQPRRISTAYAEMDFLTAARRDDIKGLKAAFGTIQVSSRSYPKAVNLLDSMGFKDSDILVAAIPNADESPYESISQAKKMSAVVLSDSPNLRRVCKREGIPQWTLKEWRLMAPTPC
jgi:hypothetical protein